MSRRFRGLGKIVKIFNPPSRGSTSPQNSKIDQGSKPEGALKNLIPHLVSLEEGFQVLERNFPIREGRGRVDWMACNSTGELILVWVLDDLEPDRLFKLIPEYDWVQKNSALWKHLFIPLRRKDPFSIQVWLVARKVDPQIPSALSYLKGIRVKIIHLQRAKQGASSPVKPTPRPTLTPAEIKDLMTDEAEDGVNYEDEITDPYCPLSELK